MIKIKVECTDGEFLISRLFASFAQVRAVIAELAAANSAVSSEETTASALNPAPAAVPGLDDPQVFEGVLAPELPATITCRNAIDRGLDLAA